MNILTRFSAKSEHELLVNLGSPLVKAGWRCHDFISDVRRVSSALKECGVKANQRVLILSGNRVETYIFTMAVINIGATAVPLNPMLGTEYLGCITREMSPVACLIDGLMDGQMLEHLQLRCRQLFDLSVSLAPTANRICYEELLECPEGVIGDFSGDHEALIVYTSGSQGSPKAIRLTHQSLLNYFHYHDLVHRQLDGNVADGETLRPLISVFHPSHLAAYSVTLQALLMRRPTALLPAFHPSMYLQYLSALRCHIAILVPSMYVALLKETELLAKLDLTSLKLCGSVGESTPSGLIERLESTLDVRVFCGYGFSEGLPGIAHSKEDLHRDNFPAGSCGRELFAEIKLVGESGEESNPGELWVRNPTIYRCYMDNSLNDNKFTVDGWLRTGDLFTVDEMGNYFHKGRIDDMFVCNGKNIYPAEVEFILSQHTDIDRVVAAPLSDIGGNTVVAVLVESRKALSSSEVISFFLQVGPKHMIPKRVKVVANLPEIGPGKLDRLAARRLLEEFNREQTV